MILNKDPGLHSSSSSLANKAEILAVEGGPTILARYFIRIITIIIILFNIIITIITIIIIILVMEGGPKILARFSLSN